VGADNGACVRLRSGGGGGTRQCLTNHSPVNPQLARHPVCGELLLVARLNNSPTHTKQRAFLDFVLSHYVSVGVEELDQEKLTPLLRLKYHDSIVDAVADLGKPEEISRAFAGFQKFLYQKTA
jgi:hypothetical protein